MTPFFSIIIPIYKAEAYLRQCVDSILAQSCGDFELILVEDGSPDGSGAICDEYAARDSRVLAVHQANAGPTPARRNGLDRARGRYVCFVDADDWVVPHWLETLRGHIQRNNEPDMVLYDLTRDVGKVKQPMRAQEGFYDKARLEAEIYPYMLMDMRQGRLGVELFPAYLWSKAGKRELIRAHFIRDDRITIFEDTSMAYECVYSASTVYISREKLYVYRRLAQSNLNHYRPKYFHELRLVQDYLMENLGGKDPALDRQINGFCMYRVISGIANEYLTQKSLVRAAANVRRALNESGFVKRIRFAGLPAFYKPFLLLVKCRCCLLATWAVKMRLTPEED